MSTEMEGAKAGEDEIVALHAFFDGWLSGRLDPAPRHLAQLDAALAPGFTMVGPAGVRLERDAVIGWIRDGHGSRGPEFRIWIEGARPLVEGEGFLAMGYDECQHIGGQDTRRRCTALFRPEGGRLVWLTVHETWVTPPV